MRRWMALGVMLVITGAARAQGSAVMTAPLLRADLPVTSVPQEALLVKREFAPGEDSGPHLHHGTEQAYVVSGQLELHVAGKAVRMVHAGDSFQVPRDTPHQAVNTGSVPAVLIVSYVMDKGVPGKVVLPSLESGPGAK